MPYPLSMPERPPPALSPEIEPHPRWGPPLVLAAALLGLTLNWVVWQDWGILAGAGVIAVGAVVVMWVSWRG